MSFRWKESTLWGELSSKIKIFLSFFAFFLWHTHSSAYRSNGLRLQVAVSNVTIDTKDTDDVLVNSFFETRDAFLNKCQKSHFQFDTLARAKYSSMVILYHLIHKPATKPTCTSCHKDILVDSCWYCDICPKFYVCESCYRMKVGVYHPHRLNPPTNPTEVVCGFRSDQVQKNKAVTVTCFFLH